MYIYKFLAAIVFGINRSAGLPENLENPVPKPII
jgi:hypothetical protein